MTETGKAGSSTRLGQLRLLVALDSILVEGSVTRAAKRMELSTAAVSRMLSQARELYRDPLMVRSGRHLVPTPRAEELRMRLRALAAEADSLLQGGTEPEQDAIDAIRASWNKKPLIETPPLAVRPSVLLDGQPSPEQLARQLDRHRNSNKKPVERLALHLAVIGRGIGSSRPLTSEEAYDAYSIIFRGEADSTQVGALLHLMRYRGETAAEMAGIVRAARDVFGFTDSVAPAGMETAALDWPMYLSPMSPRAPWFLQAAVLVAQAGHPVLLHGAGGKAEHAVSMLDIPVVMSLTEARICLETSGIAYLPLAAATPQMQGLLGLYPLFHTRSPINSAVHLVNPLSIRASFLGVAQPAYRELHRDAALLIGQQDLTVIGNNRDVGEWVPYRPATVYRIVDKEPFERRFGALQEPRGETRIGLTSPEYWHAVWRGTAVDERATRIVLATAALALMTVNRSRDDDLMRWYATAQELWERRNASK
ncbi:glycosyl transferase family protein [uncultured Nitratireductor sp.]|uniref:glycosyl transferase family protein n=1 Tax=uncultured Nitratireductor sp. TaxID=520953 RepID=UPI0025D584C5|nr:glycosyl transferase family protein [uncultured Nitratireductor sp.]